MSSWITPELNAIIITTVVAVLGAAGTYMVAWLRAKTKQLNEMATATKEMAVANHNLLEKNTEISQQIQKQTDGINRKMAAIAAATAFSRGREQGRAEGESDEPYEELDRLEDEYSKIIHSDYIPPVLLDKTKK